MSRFFSTISSNNLFSLLKNLSQKEIHSDLNDDDELSDGFVFLLYCTVAFCSHTFEYLVLKILVFSSEILSRTSIGSTSELDSSSSRPETRTIKRKSSENLQSSSSSFLSKGNERTFRLKIPLRHAKTEDLSMKDDFHLDENIRAATVTKIRHSDEENLPISTSEDET